MIIDDCIFVNFLFLVSLTPYQILTSAPKSEAIEANVESPAREGREDEARAILTNFLKDRSSQAMSEARKWINSGANENCQEACPSRA